MSLSVAALQPPLASFFLFELSLSHTVHDLSTHTQVLRVNLPTCTLLAATLNYSFNWATNTWPVCYVPFYKRCLIFSTHLAVNPVERGGGHCVETCFSCLVSWLPPPACHPWRGRSGMVESGATNLPLFSFNLLQTTWHLPWRGELYMVREALGNLTDTL